jgi:hypothetical protein
VAQLTDNTFNGITTIVDPPGCSAPTGVPVWPDRTTLIAPSNAGLRTAAGTWTFGPAQPQPGQYDIFLSGNYMGGWAPEIEVANGGQLYAYNSSAGVWWIWNGGWSRSAAP